MKTPLGMLVGMRLEALDTETDSVGFIFSACALRAFAPVKCGVALSALVGLTVSAVVALDDRLEVTFGNAGSLGISLKPADYQGPEAFVAHFADGVIVAQ